MEIHPPSMSNKNLLPHPGSNSIKTCFLVPVTWPGKPTNNHGTSPVYSWVNQRTFLNQRTFYGNVQ